MKVEGAGGVAGIGRDGMTRDCVGALFGEECSAGLEKSLARFGRSRRLGSAPKGRVARFSVGNTLDRFTDDHVSNDFNVSHEIRPRALRN